MGSPRKILPSMVTNVKVVSQIPEFGHVSGEVKAVAISGPWERTSTHFCGLAKTGLTQLGHLLLHLLISRGTTAWESDAYRGGTRNSGNPFKA